MGLDDSSELDKQKEKNTLKENVKYLEILADLAEGKVYKVHSQEEAERRLYEWNFYNLAVFELTSHLSRLNEQTVDEIGFARKYLKLNNAISEQGDWTGVKEQFLGMAEVWLSDDDGYDPERAARIGLDPHTSYYGVPLFSYKTGENQVEQRKAWHDLAEAKLSLIPDHTAPYQHPNSAELHKSLNPK